MFRVAITFPIVVFLSLMSNVANAGSFGITLRYWLTEEHATTARILPFAAYKIEDYDVEVPGFTLRWSPGFWNNNDILLSYYDSDRARLLDVVRYPPDGSPPEFGADIIGNERSDLELLVRTHANENVFFYYGLRYIEFYQRFDGSGFLFNTVPGQSESTWILAELGLGVAASISGNGRHNLFANALVAAGKTEGEQTFVINGEVSRASFPRQDARTVDLNFGYQYSMNQRTSLSLRYRELSTYLENNRALQVSGIDLGVSFNF